MNFNSLQYITFLPIGLIIYYLVPRKVKNFSLLLLSLYFYMCWEAKYVLLMLFSIFATYICGILIEKEILGKRKLWLICCLIINIGILFFFKYFNFFGDTSESLFSLIGIKFTAPTFDILLPVGISFYTFQALGYTMDVYRKDIKAEKNFIDYALFVSFFPQLVAGPIERTKNILPQLKTQHKFQIENLKDNILLILWGMMKKVLIADSLAVVVNTVYTDPYKYTGMQIVFATVCFSLQIYCDFSAYSDIARGSARMFGIDLMRNFDFPYGAQSIKDFWRRWHISLSAWFKDYLYFPLGGSRVSKTRHCVNLMIVFTVSGLWHGADMTYVMWGVLHGAYQVAGIVLKPLREKIYKIIGNDGIFLRIIKIIGTYTLVNTAWILFRANNMDDAIFIVKRILLIPFRFTLPLSFDKLGVSTEMLIVLLIAVVILVIVDSINRKKPIAEIMNKTVWIRYSIYLILLLSIFVFGYYGPGFDPQDFVYFQF